MKYHFDTEKTLSFALIVMLTLKKLSQSFASVLASDQNVRKGVFAWNFT